MDTGDLGLVGDIGGTNARFALTTIRSPEPKVFALRNLKCCDFERLEDAIDSFLRFTDITAPLRSVVLAVAGPVNSGRAVLTNNNWRISEDALLRRGFGRAKLINDYAAMGLGLIDLGASDLFTIGPERKGDNTQPIAVLGAGTGFGAAVVAPGERGARVLVTEAGHMGFAPSDDIEVEIARITARRHGRVSVERLLSGPGLREIYMALAEIAGTPMRAPSSETITWLGADDEDELCRRTLERFCAIYGAVAGDIALAVGARGGVCLAGGIAPIILKLLNQGAFRQRFEEKGRMSDYVQQIPTRVIVEERTALIGAAKQLRRLQPLAVVEREHRA